MRKWVLLGTAVCVLLSGCAAQAQPADTQTAQSSTEQPAQATPTQEIPADTGPEITEAVEPEIVVDPYQPYTYDIMMDDIEALAQMYPQLIETGSIGQSVEGREIALIKMGSGPKKLLLIGTHHAREYITTTYLMRMADTYLFAASGGEQIGGADVGALLEQVTVYIVPMLNPDGVNLVVNGIDSVQDPEAVSGIEMRKETVAEWKANINGVDLNRQYPCFWDEKKSPALVPSSEMYKGEQSASEPEVQAVIGLCERNDFELAASFHTKGEIIYWADSGTMDRIEGAQQIADALSEATGYELKPVSQDPAAYGAGFENWFRMAYEKPGFCIELTPTDGTSLPHDDADFDALVWDKAQDIGIVLMRSAAGMD